MASSTFARQRIFQDFCRFSWARAPRRPYASHTRPCRSRNTQDSHGQPPNPNSKERPSTPASSAKSASLSRYSRPFSLFFKWYAGQQRVRPFLTQLWTFPIIYFVGDLTAQMIGNDDYDFHRTLRAMITGAAVSYPSYRWFIFLGSRFNYASAAVSTGVKVTVSQLLYAPLFQVSFFSLQALLSGEGAAGAVERVKTAVPESLPRSFLYWPVATAITLTYARPQSHSAVSGMFAIVWQAYMSWVNSRVDKQDRGSTVDPGVIPAVNPRQVMLDSRSSPLDATQGSS